MAVNISEPTPWLVETPIADQRWQFMASDLLLIPMRRLNLFAISTRDELKLILFHHITT